VNCYLASILKLMPLTASLYNFTSQTLAAKACIARQEKDCEKLIRLKETLGPNYQRADLKVVFQYE